jgi:hypothetical protein
MRLHAFCGVSSRRVSIREGIMAGFGVPRRAVAVATAAVVMAGVMAIGRPAGAATENGTLHEHSVGSLYSDATANVALAAGKTGKFSLEVVNTGDVTTQYAVVVTPSFGPATFAIVAGSTPVSGLRYWTPPVAAGKAYVFTLTASIPAGTPEANTSASVQLYAADNTSAALATRFVWVSEAAPKAGTSANDIFLKNGTQPATGGPVDEYMGSPAATVGKTEKFSVRVQNDSAANASDLVKAALTPLGTCNLSGFAVTYKVGTTDITTAITGAGYATPTLLPGKSVVITESVKYAVAQPGCTALYTGFSSGPFVQYTQVPIAVS